eukprot:g10555.t1
MQEVKTTEINESPLQPNDIGNLEIEMENDEVPELTRCRKCRILCGRESILVSMVVLALGGGNIFIFSGYAGGFNREGLWVFFALGILSCLLVVSFIVRTCKAVQPKNKKKTEEENDGKDENQDENKEENQEEEKKPSKIAAMFDTMKTRYNHLFDVNGKYYLSKMYAAELFEHAQQVYSLTTIYLCLMPVETSTIVCAVLTVELLINIWATFHIGSQEVRDRLIFLDILTDVFCMAFPLAYSRFALNMPIHLEREGKKLAAGIFTKEVWGGKPTKIVARQRGKVTEFASPLGLQQPTDIVARQRGKVTEFAQPPGLQQPTKILAG